MTAVLIPHARPGGAEPIGSASVEVRPADAVPIRRAGRSPSHVLLFGGGVLAGWGLLDHERGLPGMLADGLAQATERGIDLDVVVDLDPTLPAGRQELQRLRIARYDAIVVLLGERQSLEHLRRGTWADEVGTLLEVLDTERAPASSLLVVDCGRSMVAVSRTGFQRFRAVADAGRHAEVARGLCGSGGAGFTELKPPANPLGWGRQFSTASYREWSAQIVKTLLPALQDSAQRTGPGSAAAVRGAEQEEAARQSAVNGMGLSGLARSGLLDGLVRQARTAVKGSVAFLGIVDGDRVWQRASSRSLLVEVPRELAFCDDTVRSDELHLVNDSHLDPRFGGEVPVAAGDALAFYVGEPIRSVDGYRIGALCVTDGQPRQADPSGFSALHVLAARIEKELWANAGAHQARIGARAVPPRPGV